MSNVKVELVLCFSTDLLSCRPDVGVFGLQVRDADPFVTLFPHKTVSMELRVGRHRCHQLHHNTGWTLVVTDLKHENSQELYSLHFRFEFSQCNTLIAVMQCKNIYHVSTPPS